VHTDPPYNISQKNKIFRDYRNGNNGDIVMDFGAWDYGFDCFPFLVESKRILNDDGSIIVWTSEQLYGTYLAWFAEHMYPQQLMVWVKSNPLPQFRLIGYRQATELLYWALKNKNTKRNPNFLFQTQQEMVNVFYAPIVGGKERVRSKDGKRHPTQKPLAITEKIIQRHCRVDGLVVDPFMGVGTTLVAAKKLNRRALGIELSQDYCDMAIERLAKLPL
jgi:DNA modification methylase